MGHHPLQQNATTLSTAQLTSKPLHWSCFDHLGWEACQFGLEADWAHVGLVAWRRLFARADSLKDPHSRRFFGISISNGFGSLFVLGMTFCFKWLFNLECSWRLCCSIQEAVLRDGRMLTWFDQSKSRSARTWCSAPIDVELMSAPKTHNVHVVVAVILPYLTPSPWCTAGREPPPPAQHRTTNEPLTAMTLISRLVDS